MELTVLGCCHIKPMFYDETVEELACLDGRVRVLSDGDTHLL